MIWWKQASMGTRLIWLLAVPLLAIQVAALASGRPTSLVLTIAIAGLALTSSYLFQRDRAAWTARQQADESVEDPHG